MDHPVGLKAACVARSGSSISGNPPRRQAGRLVLRQSPRTDGARTDQGRLGPWAGHGSRDWTPPLIYAPAPDQRAASAQLTPPGWGSESGLEGWGGGGVIGLSGPTNWVAPKGWYDRPRGLASFTSPLVSCSVCAACVHAGGEGLLNTFN